jgi:hypothetical protein
MYSYSSSLQQLVKWYRKLAVKAVLSMAMVIAHFLHKKTKQEDISVTELREEIV